MPDLESEFAERKFAERFVERETALTLLKSGYTQGETAFILGTHPHVVTAYNAGFRDTTEYTYNNTKKRTNPETGKPFESQTEYSNYLARRRTNPKTGKLYKSKTDYETQLAKSKGFSNLWEYQRFIKNPAVLIIDALMHKSPSTIRGIRDYIAETVGIKFGPEKLERVIEKVNNLRGQLFIEQNKAYSLNIDSELLKEMLRASPRQT